MLKEIESKYKPGYYIDWGAQNIGKLAKFLGLDSEYTKTLSKTVGKEYRDTTTRDHNRNIKNRKDANREAERVLNLIKSMS